MREVAKRPKLGEGAGGVLPDRVWCIFQWGWDKCFVVSSAAAPSIALPLFALIWDYPKQEIRDETKRRKRHQCPRNRRGVERKTSFRQAHCFQKRVSERGCSTFSGRGAANAPPDSSLPDAF